MAEILNFDDKKEDTKQKILEEINNLKQMVEEDKVDYILTVASMKDGSSMNQWLGELNPTMATGQLEFFKHSLLNIMDSEYE